LGGGIRTAKEATGFKLLRAAAVLIPAAIFIAYYLSGLHHRATTAAPVTPPPRTVSPGSAVNLGGYTFTAGQPFFTRTVNEPGNTIMANPNQVFVIIPVVAARDNLPVEPAGVTWRLVDDAGIPHPPLRPKDLEIPPAVAQNPARRPVYLLFSLPDTSRHPFLLLTAPAGEAAWRLTRSG